MRLKFIAITCLALALPGAVSMKMIDAHRDVIATPSTADDQIRIIPAVVHYCGFINRQHVATFLQPIDPSRPAEHCPHPPSAASSIAHTTA